MKFMGMDLMTVLALVVVIGLLVTMSGQVMV